MAWLKGLAGKAEDFLNQIDQNAAVALQGDKKTSDSKETLLTEVTWESQTPKRDLLSKPTSDWSPATPAKIPTVRSTPNLNNLSPARIAPKKQNDEELITFLNSSEPTGNIDVPSKQMSASVQPEINMLAEPESHTFVPVKFETLNENPSNLANSESSQSSSRRSSPQEILSDPTTASSVQPTSVIVVEKSTNGILTSNHMSDVSTENEMLRNELRTLNNEMSLLLHRAKSAEKECQNQQTLRFQLQERADLVNQLKQELLTAQQQSFVFQETLHTLQVEKDKLVRSENSSDNEAHKTLQDELDTVKNKHKQEMTTMESRLQKMQEECQRFEQQFVEVKQHMTQKENTAACLQQQMERARLEAQASREELDQYRLRAQRILQDKEKLISELRGEGQNTQDGNDDTIILELQQLREERELLREETAQVTARLQVVRDELLEAEKRLETCREQAADSQHKLQERLSEERKKRQAAEEDCKTHGEELRSVRDELSRQRSLLASRVREREAELTRLRTQLAQRPASPTDDELESRLHTLTQTLVQKQNTLETVTTEKNALRLQLEKMERKNQEMVMLLQQRQAGIINVNDTDDAKAQIPRFFVETPFDTGMTRRVKRAYSSLDAVSIRTGVFLRRYPLARILVLCYMVLLHLWVMLVLFTYTPQAQ